MAVMTALQAFLTDGTLTRPRADTTGARRAGLPRQTVRVGQLPQALQTEKPGEAAEDRDYLLAKRHLAKSIEAAERAGAEVPGYGPVETWMIQGKDGECRTVTDRLSRLRDAFPDQDEADVLARAGVTVPTVAEKIFAVDPGAPVASPAKRRVASGWMSQEARDALAGAQ